MLSPSHAMYSGGSRTVISEGHPDVGVVYEGRTVRWRVEVDGVQETGEVRMRECEGADYRERDSNVETDVKCLGGQSNAAWLHEYGRQPG